MQVKCSAWGASVAVRLPSSLVEELDIQAGDYLRIDSNERGEIVMWPAKEDAAITSDVDSEPSEASATRWHDEDVLEAPEGW
jgi:antitoxin component of MazEF toxin-antitoxin module